MSGVNGQMLDVRQAKSNEINGRPCGCRMDQMCSACAGPNQVLFPVLRRKDKRWLSERSKKAWRSRKRQKMARVSG